MRDVTKRVARLERELRIWRVIVLVGAIAWSCRSASSPPPAPTELTFHEGDHAVTVSASGITITGAGGATTSLDDLGLDVGQTKVGDTRIAALGLTVSPGDSSNSASVSAASIGLRNGNLDTILDAGSLALAFGDHHATLAVDVDGANLSLAGGAPQVDLVADQEVRVDTKAGVVKCPRPGGCH
jgi:hypothetical protein